MTQANHLLETMDPEADLELLMDTDGEENFTAQDDATTLKIRSGFISRKLVESACLGQRRKLN
jgi:hypothetical protein